MNDDAELDAREAAVSKELAIRLSLGLLFVVLAYIGVARVFDAPTPPDAPRHGHEDAADAVTR